MRKLGEQLHFVCSDIYDRFVPRDHYLRKVLKLLDFSFVDKMCEKKYKTSSGGPGRPAEPPQRLFKLLLLMFLYQVKFEREVERRTNDSLSWRWFCGYEADEPVASHKTLWLFRQRLGPELFDQIFAKLVEQCMVCGLIGKNRYHIDATKQDAAATTFSQFEVAVILTKAMIDRLSSMQGVEPVDTGEPPSEMDTEMKTLVAKAAVEAANLKKVSPARVLAKAEDRPYEPGADESKDEDSKPGDGRKKALLELGREIWREHAHAKGDKDARIGKTSVKKSFCGYISTIVVDEKRGIALGYTTEPGNVDQGKTFDAAYDAAVSVAGKPKEAALDRAFDLVGIRKRLENDEVQGYIPMIRTHRAGNVFGSERFSVTYAKDHYEVLCPGGLLMRQVKARKNGSLVFRGAGCAGCALQNKCTTAQDGLRYFEFEPELRRLQEQHWQMRKTDEYKTAMKRRMSTIEPVFGHGKTFHNLGKSIYRSLPMQRIQTAMSLFAVNLEKLVRYAPQAT